MSFKKINPEDIKINPFSMIGKEWFLVTGGNMESYNTMTASWGQLGFLWRMPTFTTVVRPNRLTYDFMEKNDFFTISFFDEDCRDMLNYCGSHSGRDVDKAKETGLIPQEFENSTVAFEQAKLIFVCRKLYAKEFDEGAFVDTSLLQLYQKDPMHKAYIGEIVAVYEK